MARRAAALPFFALALALGTAGCGASDDGRRRAASDTSPTSVEARTQSQFVADAKAICAAPDETVSPDLAHAPTEKQLKVAMDVWRNVVRELRKLEPPTGEEARVDRMLTHFENAIRIGRRVAAVDDETTLAVFAGLFDQGSRGAAIAHSYGLDVCSPIPAMPPAGELSENKAFRDAMLELIRQVEKNDPSLVRRP